MHIETGLPTARFPSQLKGGTINFEETAFERGLGSRLRAPWEAEELDRCSTVASAFHFQRLLWEGSVTALISKTVVLTMSSCTGAPERGP